MRLRSGDASNLKAILKKIIHDVTASAAEGEDPELSAGKDVRRMLIWRVIITSNASFRGENISTMTSKPSTPTSSLILETTLLSHSRIVKLLIAVYSQI